MIVITPVRHADGLELTVCGHAGADVYGRDIVCAAVSALCFGLVAYLSDEPSVRAMAERDAATHRLPGRGGQGSLALAVGNGRLWVRTRDMTGVDRAAWELTRAGLSLVADRYPTCVLLHATREET